MDNDNKVVSKVTDILNIEEQRHKDVLLFLQEELEPLKFRNNANSYNLEKEYAKTKKNKSFFIPLILSACIFIIALVSFILTRSIEKTNNEISVNVAEFDDVNLKNLIDTVARTQDQYEAAVKNKTQIEVRKRSLLNAAADKRDGDLVMIQSLNLRDKKDQAAREEAVKKEYENSVKEINAEYDPLLLAADSEIEAYKTKLDDYDKAKLTAAQEQQKALDSQRQLQELERKKMAENYENRIADLEYTVEKNRRQYQDEMRKSLFAVSKKLQDEIDTLDPVIKDDRASEIFDDYDFTDEFSVNPEENALFGAGNISDTELREAMADVKEMYQDYKYIEEKVQAIPHKNTIGDYVKLDATIVDLVTDTLADSVYEQYKEKVSLKHEIQTMKEDIQKMKQDHAKEIETINENHQNEIAKLNKEKEELVEGRFDVLYESMRGSGISSVIAESPVSKDEIYVLIRPDARFLLGENAAKGCDAEIPFKKAIKGRVEKTEDGRFRFIPEMKNGKYVDFDLEALKMGVQVKLK
ncbi:MAG: hypothetical protein MJ182_00840 [Treponema sp.]|nr:hypothetical protein [Treponema sp.]